MKPIRILCPSISRCRATLRMTGEERRSPVMLSLSKHQDEQGRNVKSARGELVEPYEHDLGIT